MVKSFRTTSANEAAIRWMYIFVQKEFNARVVKNLRLAKADNPEELRIYASQLEAGHSNADAVVTLDGENYLIGCSYET